jgi:hypothetical protein
VVLVHAHLRAAPELVAGVPSLFGARSAFAATQATWRFLNNERVSWSALVEPLRDVGRQRVADLQAGFVLLVHDWSKLTFGQSRRKRDLVQLTHGADVGYELTTALLVSADDGSPLAPMEMHLRTGEGVLSTRSPPQAEPHLEQVLPTTQAAETWGLSKPIVHVIDREADSVDHYRRWDAAGAKFLVRADDRRVEWNGESCLLSQTREQLLRQKAFRCVGDAEYRGRPARLWTVETEVVLYRPAKKNVRGKRYELPGRVLSLRLILVQLRNKQGEVLAEWMLLSNVPREYYWRWRIESFFKLLKSHGQQLEQWQQQTGSAIARRLLIAAMACVVVWQLQADDSPKALDSRTSSCG